MIKNYLKRATIPLRAFLGRNIILPYQLTGMSLIEKAAWLVAADEIDGDYLEFGVFRGSSLIAAYHTLHRVFEDCARMSGTEQGAKERRAIWHRMRFFAFDSFEGLPELKGIDCHSRDFAKGQYSASVEHFLENTRKSGIPSGKIVTVPGWFEQTCNPATADKYKMRKASIIWIDCDLYESCRSVLSFIHPFLQDGSILIFDDWYNFRGNPRLGEQAAMREWSENIHDFTFTEYQKEGAWRASFIASLRN